MGPLRRHGGVEALGGLAQIGAAAESGVDAVGAGVRVGGGVRVLGGHREALEAEVGARVAATRAAKGQRERAKVLDTKKEAM